MVLLIRFFVTWNHYMLKSVIFQLWKYFWRCTLLYQYQVSYFNVFLVTKIWRYTVIEGILLTQSYFLPNIASIIFVNKMWLFCWFNISISIKWPPQFSSVQSLSHVSLFVTPWIAAHQASLSITNSRSSPKLMSIESVMPSIHLILCRPLLLLPPIPPSIRIFSN